jgi:hypothetical protein
MSSPTTFGEVLEVAGALPIEEQESLLEILHRRIIESRREAIAQDIREAETEFETGQSRPVTVDALMNEILT